MLCVCVLYTCIYVGWKNRTWPLGRYFEGLEFYVNSNITCSATDSMCTGDVHMDVFSAYTVYPSALWYEVDVQWMQFNESALMMPTFGDTEWVNGQICVSGDPHTGDLLFDCKRKGLPEQTSDTVLIFS